MAELSYPKFPLRPLAAIGVLTVALGTGAILINRSQPSVGDCAAAAEHIMASHDYSVSRMRADGPGPIRACHGLSAGQFSQALLDGYVIEYGRNLPRTPIPHDVPPPGYRAISARWSLRSGDKPSPHSRDKPGLTVTP